jgi:hypothetical protein
MANKKIKFQTLQRFDLKDANELQEGVISNIKGVAKAFNGHSNSELVSGGPIKKVTVTGVSSGVVTFGPLDVLSGNSEEVITLSQDDVDNGLTQIDIQSLHATYISQRDAGNAMTGIYFYAYPLSEDVDVETRQFYSVIDAIPENRSIATRERRRLTFFAQINNPSYNIVDANGNAPIYLGHVLDANILDNNNSPFVPSNFKSSSYFSKYYGAGNNYDDTGLPNAGENDFTGNDTLSDGNTYAGIRLPFERLRRQLNRIVSYGTSDYADTETLSVDAKPVYSLQGLYRLITFFDNLLSNRITALEGVKSATIYYEFTTDDITGVESHNIYKNDDDNDFDVDLTFNWQLIQDEGRLAFPQSLPGIAGDTGAVEAVYSNVVLTLPDDYLAAKIISISATPINYGLTGGGVSDAGSIDRSVQDRWPEVGRVLPDGTNSYTGHNQINALTWLTQNGTSDSGPALFFKVGPSDAFTAGSGNHFGIQFDISLKFEE